jgi:hypothetical protein
MQRWDEGGQRPGKEKKYIPNLLIHAKWELATFGERRDDFVVWGV